MDVPQLAEKLKQARLAAGLSTRIVAERLSRHNKISHTTLTNYEAGRTQPTLEIISTLASIYERPINWFLSPSINLSNIRYRNRKSKVRIKELNHYEANAIKWINAYRNLEISLGEQRKRQFVICADYKNLQPSKVASSFRKTVLRLDDDEKIDSVIDVLDRLSIRVMELPTEVAIDGFAANANDEYVVMLNTNVSSDRARLNAAHELGHILFGDCDSSNIDNDGPNEARAYEFASHLLLTDRMLNDAMESRSMVELVRCKERFRISIAAMIFRAEKQQIISKSLAKRIWMEITKRGWRNAEPGKVTEDRAWRFEQILDSAIMQRKLTWEEAAVRTGVRVDELRERRDWILGFQPENVLKKPNQGRGKPFLRLVRSS